MLRQISPRWPQIILYLKLLAPSLTHAACIRDVIHNNYERYFMHSVKFICFLSNLDIRASAILGMAE